MNARIFQLCTASSRASLVCIMLAAAVPTSAWAHHSMAEYDASKTVEVEGTLVEVRWQNPHVRLSVRVTDAQGQPVLWEIEGNSLNALRRASVSPDRLKIGDKVRVAGQPSKKAPNRMLGSNVLQADGTEFVFIPTAPPRWASTVIGSKSTWFDEGTAEKASSGIFRVWSTKLGTPGPFWLRSYPLTDAAKKIVASWDPINNTVAQDCKPQGMPTIMEQPYPIEFLQKKDTILLRMEEYDTVRTIYMSDKVASSTLPTSPLGRSTGHWEGTTLVVKTDGITWPHLDPRGTPLSPAATLVERFTPTPDGTGLQYSLDITDPQVLTKPVELMRSWVARPNEAVLPYNCGRS